MRIRFRNNFPPSLITIKLFFHVRFLYKFNLKKNNFFFIFPHNWRIQNKIKCITYVTTLNTTYVMPFRTPGIQTNIWSLCIINYLCMIANYLWTVPILCRILGFRGAKCFLHPVAAEEHFYLEWQTPVVRSHYHALADLALGPRVLQCQPPIGMAPLNGQKVPISFPFNHWGSLKPAAITTKIIIAFYLLYYFWLFWKLLVGSEIAINILLNSLTLSLCLMDINRCLKLIILAGSINKKYRYYKQHIVFP